jgi:hypothetical protein
MDSHKKAKEFREGYKSEHFVGGLRAIELKLIFHEIGSFML